MVVKFGLQQTSFSFGGPPEGIYPTVERIAVEAERLGFDSFWLMDHFIQLPPLGGEDAPILEPWVALSALATRTSRIRLGTLVLGTPYRNPALVAKMGATLDVVSGGRLFLGIGGGWFQREFEAYGWDFPPVRERGRRLGEAVQIIHRMWTEEHPTFEGAYYTIRDARCEPRPLQKPHPPIMVGGGGERVTLRILAQQGDACNLFGDPASIRHKLDVLERHCQEVGRDPGAILKTRLSQMLIAPTEAEVRRKVERYIPGGLADEGAWWANMAGTSGQIVEACHKLRQVGVEYFIFAFPDAHTLEPLHLFMEEVAPALAGHPG